MAFVRKSRQEPRYNEDGRGRFKVTYETPNNNIGSDRFETKSEAARFADSLRKRGYKNVTIGESLIDEAVAQQDRYIRVHGKPAKGTARWMFTTKAMGDFDMKN